MNNKSGRVFDIPSEQETKSIQAGIDADDDAFTLDEFKTMRPVGRPKQASRKILVSIRLSPEVVEYFRATGKGWQTRLDEVLKAYVASHK